MEKSYRFTTPVPDSLIEELQQIFTDPANDEKTASAKNAIYTWHKESNAEPMQSAEDGAIVTKAQLEAWLSKIKEYNQFKADAEVDIGYIAEALHNLTNLGNPGPLIMKLLSGNLKPEAMGLDVDKIVEIAKKYAPAKCAELAAKTEKK